MKRITKGYTIFFIIVFYLLFIFPISVNAEVKETDYINVNSKIDIALDDLYFNDITFIDNSKDSSMSFGLIGNINNKSRENISYTSKVNYFDKNHNLLVEVTNTSTALVNTNSFNQMSNISILGTHKVKEIAYYKLSITKNETSKVEYTPSSNYMYNNYTYVIDKYNVNIKVNENNTLDITETIVAYFSDKRHGLYRTIPLKNELNRADGTKTINKVQISNVSVNDEYQTSRENNKYVIQIGSANQTILGEKTYIIKYTYNIGKDKINDYDELYFNIIGPEWDTVIGNVSFIVTMPKEFDQSKIGFTSGKVGSTNNNVEYNVTRNTIRGSYNGILNKGDGLTIRCELPEGYFINARYDISLIDILMFLVPIIGVLLSFILWFKFGRDDDVIETVEFYPPEGFNSLEVGFLYKGKAEKKDVTSLLIYLANKGYIRISEIEEKYLFTTTKGFKITKLKEYDGNNLSEELFLEGLFKDASINNEISEDGVEELTENLGEVTSNTLQNSFYMTMAEILSNVNKKENKNQIFEKTASSKNIFIILMIIAAYCIITIPPVLAYGESNVLVFALLFPGIGFTIMFSMLLNASQTIYVNGRPTRSKIWPILFALIWGLGFGGIPWATIMLPILLENMFLFVSYMIGLGCILGMLIFLKYLPKRTKYGNQILGKLKGFKNFLETAEKENLEAMVEKEPSYFYNILPYTYVLNVSDKWIKKFEAISIMPPTWYDSNEEFNLLDFSTFMDSTMISAEAAMSSSPSDSSSSGSSGGGFSGGGSGGGGGSSW